MWDSTYQLLRYIINNVLIYIKKYTNTACEIKVITALISILEIVTLKIILF